MTTQITNINRTVTPYPVNETPVVETKWVQVDGAILFSKCFGSKGSAIIVIPGGPGFSHDYLVQLAEISKSNRVIFYDPRGCGISTGEVNDATINMPTFLRDLDAVREAFALEEVSVLGHSAGGLIAMRYAIEYKQRVSKLVLLNSMDAFYKHDPTPKQDYVASIRAIKASAGFQNDRADEISRAYETFFAGAFYKREHLAKLNLNLATLQSAKNSVLIREAIERTLFEHSFDFQQELNALTVQALIIHSANDFIPYSVAENLHRVLSNSDEPLVIKECGHFALTEHPGIVCKYVNSFLN